jgi:hypothetical protein
LVDAGEPNAPDFIEPVVGWRAWRIGGSFEEPSLLGAFHMQTWPPLEPVAAVCRALRFPWRAAHAAPEERCACGVHGAQFEHFAAGYPSMAPPGLYFPVLGPVAMWGKIVVTRFGWRGEFAYPQRLYVPIVGRRLHLTRRLAAGLERYGVGVELIDPPGEPGYGLERLHGGAGRADELLLPRHGE